MLLHRLSPQDARDRSARTRPAMFTGGLKQKQNEELLP